MIGILAAVVLVILFLLVTLFVGLIFEALAEEELENNTTSEESDNKEVTLNIYNHNGEIVFCSKFDNKDEAIKFLKDNNSVRGMRFTIE